MTSFRTAAAFAAGVLSLALASGAPAQDADKTIRIGLQPAPLLGFIMQDQKLLEKRGYTPEYTVFPFSPPILEGMAAGSIDIALLGIGPTLSVVQRDAGVTYIYDELANAAGMIVGVDSGIEGPADLKGKAIAFPGKSSQLYAMLRMYLAGTGVDDSDIDLIRANATDMNTLLDHGEVVGIVAWPPYTSEPVRLGTAKQLFDANGLGIEKAGFWPNSGWGVRTEYAAEHRDAVLAVVESLHEAIRFETEHPDEAYEIYSKASGYPVEAVRFMLENGFVSHYPAADSAPSADAMIKVFRAFEENDIVRDLGKAEDDIRAAVDPSFVEEVLAKGQ
ncbi:MAG: ABC transporter substrate-binding protein [Rhodobacteraceae bacterium]|jgi:sulfonate transport system substrate-binding protein|nr:ABC transporter substrate-binding protein [Paracoccaceae bacterium]